MKLTVTVLDTTGIQPYIFGSNRLRENIGASYLVAQVTTTWVNETLASIGITDPEQPIDKPDQNAERVYAGGGNTVLLFKSRELAIKFTQILSRRVIKTAPGINLVVVHRDFEWDCDSLRATVQDMMKIEMDEKKRSRIPSAPLLGLGVTQDCMSTRLVAVDQSTNHGSPDDYPVSREIAAKLDVTWSTHKNDEANNLANVDLKRIIFDPKIPNSWRIPLDFDDFGRSKGEISYIAIVHIDGNSMGKRFQEYGGKDESGNTRSNRDYITAMRELSKSVEEAGKASLRKITQDLINAMPKLQEELDLNKGILPFRPLVYGGDDVTFVCDGRLGLELAALYLQEFEKQPVADEKPLTACAGVSIVKVHYPFARAYELSEALCKQAKKFAKFDPETKRKRNDALSGLDWHIAMSGLSGSITEIRKRKYQAQPGPLTMRPVLLKEHEREWRTWKAFQQVIQEFEKEEWKERKNKVMALREVLRRGKDATSQFLKAYRLSSLPKFPEAVGKQRREDFAEKGWSGNECGYFDPIEAMDFYVGLEKDNAQVSSEN